MTRKEWLAPALVALVAFAGLWLAQPWLASLGGEAPPPLAYPFHGARTVDGPATLLAVDARQTHGIGANGTHLWQSPHVATVTTTPLPDGCDCLGEPWNHVPSASQVPRFGLDGYNATRLSVYVFDADGALVASNAPQADRARFLDGAKAEDLPDATWYFGANATTPAGTQRLPSAAAPLVQDLLGQLHGLPVHGVASAATDRLDWLYGTLYVTVRIDGLTHAP